MKKVLKVLFVIILTVLIVLSAPIFMLTVWELSNPPLADRLTEEYSNDDNYVRLSGEVDSVGETNKNLICIKCEELKSYLSYEDDYCTYEVFWNEPIDISVGDYIEFVTVPSHHYDGHDLPIVELVVDGNTVLTFEDGKQNLLDCVEERFK